MKKNLFLLFLFFCCFSSVFAIKVNVEEIKIDKKVEFINYEGKPKIRERVEDILGIGYRLASGEKNIRYAVLHIFDKKDPLFPADIFMILEKAKIDHIKNVRRIISAYLSRKYNYSLKEAETLAYFITIYNAVYRQNLEYFEQKYQKAVIKNLVKEKIGIALKYTDWAGKTQMLIPLSEQGTTSNLDKLKTTELTDKKVIEELKKQEDMGIEKRKEIVKIQEKEIQKEEKQLLKEKENLKEEKKQIEELTKKTETEKKELEKEKKELETLKKENPEKIQEIKEKEKQIQEKEKEIQKEEKKIEEKKQEIIQKNEQIAQKEEKLKEEKKQIEEEKKEIAKDEKILVENKKTPEQLKQELKEKEKELVEIKQKLEEKEKELANKSDNNMFQGGFYYLKVKDFYVTGHYVSELFLIDASTQTILKKSSLQNISGKKLDIFEQGVVVLTFEGEIKQPVQVVHRLTLLDLKTLEVKKVGKDPIFARSFIEVRENKIYAVTIGEKKQYYLACFDTDLNQIAISKEPIHEDSAISFFGDLIYVNSGNKNILVLSKKDLSKVASIQP